MSFDKSHLLTAKNLSKLYNQPLKTTIEYSNDFFSSEIQHKLSSLLELNDITSKLNMEIDKEIKITKIYKKIYTLLGFSDEIELKNIILNDFIELVEQNIDFLFPTLLKLYDEYFFNQQLSKFMRNNKITIIISWDKNVSNADTNDKNVVFSLNNEYFLKTKQNNDILLNFLLNFENELLRNFKELDNLIK